MLKFYLYLLLENTRYIVHKCLHCQTQHIHQILMMLVYYNILYARQHTCIQQLLRQESVLVTYLYLQLLLYFHPYFCDLHREFGCQTYFLFGPTHRGICLADYIATEGSHAAKIIFQWYERFLWFQTLFLSD